MTLSQSLDVLKEVWLTGDGLKFAKVGGNLIREIKSAYFQKDGIPKDGWFLCIEDNIPTLVNSEVRIPINFTPQSRAWNQRNKLLAYYQENLPL